MKYLVTFKYSSFYEDESENKVVDNHTLEYEAKDLDELWKILGEEDYDDETLIFN